MISWPQNRLVCFITPLSNIHNSTRISNVMWINDSVRRVFQFYWSLRELVSTTKNSDI